DELRRQTNWHSEQKFAHDLIAQHRADPDRFKDSTFDLQGGYPPCPACHAAMRRAAQETGATITYTWGDGTMTYSGDSAPVASTPEAQRYNYPLRDNGSWTDGETASPGAQTLYGQRNRASQSWGYDIEDSAWDTYSA